MNVIAKDPRREALLAAAEGPLDSFDVSNPALYEHEAWGLPRRRAAPPGGGPWR